MCRSCDETSDGQGRRCGRPDGGFPSAEREGRTISRGFDAAAAALGGGDPVAAANALNRSAAALHRLSESRSGFSGAPGEHIDTFISPGDLPRVTQKLTEINQARARAGRPPIEFETAVQTRPHGTDPIMVWARGGVRVYGPAAETEAVRATVFAGSRMEQEVQVSTLAVLGAAVSATRQTGGYVSVNAGADVSTPGMVDQFVANPAGTGWREMLTPTAEDEQTAARIRGWLRARPAGSDYDRSLSAAVARDYMPLKSVRLVASAIVPYERHEAETARLRAQAERNASPDNVARGAAQRQAAGVPKPLSGKWLGRVGTEMAVRGEVVLKESVHYPGRAQDRTLYVIRDPWGNMVKWLATSHVGMVQGDFVTISGKVKSHDVFNGERQTSMHYCKVRIEVPAS